MGIRKIAAIIGITGLLTYGAFEIFMPKTETCVGSSYSSNDTVVETIKYWDGRRNSRMSIRVLGREIQAYDIGDDGSFEKTFILENGKTYDYKASGVADKLNDHILQDLKEKARAGCKRK